MSADLPEPGPSPEVGAMREVAAVLWDQADVLQGLEAETLAALAELGNLLGQPVPEAHGDARHAAIFAAHESFRIWAAGIDEEAHDLEAEAAEHQD